MSKLTLNKLLKINKDLEESNTKLNAKVTKLSEKLEVCKESLNNLEQYTRRECLEVYGIPELQDENTDKHVIKVGSLMGVEFNKEDISVSHRIPKLSFSSVAARNWNNVEASAPKIIVKFPRRDTRDRFYVARKNLRDNSNPMDYLHSPVKDSFFLFPTTSREIEVEISNLRIGKAVGQFGVPIDILKFVKCVVSKPLEMLFNVSFSFGIVACDLKLANVVPVYTKDHKHAYKTIALFLF